jgi:hypothetical protein
LPLLLHLESRFLPDRLLSCSSVSCGVGARWQGSACQSPVNNQRGGAWLGLREPSPPQTDTGAGGMSSARGAGPQVVRSATSSAVTLSSTLPCTSTAQQGNSRRTSGTRAIFIESLSAAGSVCRAWAFLSHGEIAQKLACVILLLEQFGVSAASSLADRQREPPTALARRRPRWACR